MNTNTKYKEVGLQSKLKLVMSKVTGQFSGSADSVVARALAVINTVAGANRYIGFSDRITGVGTLLGNVLVLDLEIPLMKSTVTLSGENTFNFALANALVREFGQVNVGYLSPNPVTTQTITIKVQTDIESPIQNIKNALKDIGTVLAVS